MFRPILEQFRLNLSKRIRATGSAPRRSAHRRLTFESLERRELLSATALVGPVATANSSEALPFDVGPPIAEQCADILARSCSWSCDGGAPEPPVLSIPNTLPVVDAGPDRLIAVDESAVLNGIVTDDGRPAPARLTAAWSKLSGPGDVVFANPDGAATTAQFSAIGTYVLQLSAHDGEFWETDTVTVVVEARLEPHGGVARLAPVVLAGPDLTFEVPSSAKLAAQVVASGPAGSTCALLWTRVSGPGTVTFGNAAATATTAPFSEAGTYVLRLTASDGEREASDEVEAIVTEPANVANALAFDEFLPLFRAWQR